jgi:predicted RNA-binding Zn-ribbon protein involved in translation (DUF1610 family)
MTDTTTAIDRCPACESADIWTADTASTVQQTRLDMVCTACGAEWAVRHTFAEIEWEPKQ